MKPICAAFAASTLFFLESLMPQSVLAKTESVSSNPRLYVGSYATRGGKGISLFDFDTRTGKVTPKGLVATIPNASFIAIHPNRKWLYAVSEIDNYQGKQTGAVYAYAIDSGTGKLKQLNAQPTRGTIPCHLIVDRTGKTLLLVNYLSGSAATFPIKTDGKLGPVSSLAQHHGSGPNKARQEGPHAHSIRLDFSNRFAYVADLGIDKVMVYRFDPKSGGLTPNKPPSAAMPPGSGPRHFAFHPSGRFAFVNGELDSTVNVLRVASDTGKLKLIQSVSTLPPGDATPNNTTSEVLVSPNGKFVYCANRGHDSLALFKVDGRSGRLTSLGHQKTEGKTPRNFNFDPSGRFLVVGNQDSDQFVVFQVNANTGKLKLAGKPTSCPMPVCFQFLPGSGLAAAR